LSAGRIASVGVQPVDIPLVDPFVISRGALAAASSAFVSVTLQDGVTGYGEIAPFEALTGETRDASVDVARRLGATLVGQPAADWEALAHDLAARHPANPAARAGLECALADAAARERGLTLFALLGGADVRERTTDITLPILAEDRIDALAAHWYARGFRDFKLKVGNDVGAEVRRVERLARGFGDVSFVLDANQGFDVTAARAFMRALTPWRERITMIEQPVPRADLDGMAALRAEGICAIAADESVFSLADARRVIDAGAADIVNLKIMKSGFAETLAIARAVRAAGLRLMIGGMMETRLAMSFSFALVLGLGGVDFLDLDTPLLMASDPLSGGYQYHGAKLSLWVEPGVGMAPRDRLS
jgi:o-succinylbenzoate synthase